MSILLAVMTYPGGNAALKRHWPFFLRQDADWVYIITTEGDPTDPPLTAHKRSISSDFYISGRHLPQRMLDTITELLKDPWDVLILTEYDVLFLNRIRVEAMEHAIAAHYAGGVTWSSKANRFYHNPWVFLREAAINFVQYGQEAIDEGVCDRERGQPDPPEASPDVFFGYVTDKHNMPVQSNLWKEYSRNSLDLPGHLDEARMACRNGWDVVHGVKTESELEYITGWTRY